MIPAPAAWRSLAARSTSMAIKGGTRPRREGRKLMAYPAREGCHWRAAFAMRSAPSPHHGDQPRMSETTPARLLGMSGSLRSGSYSNAVLETLRENFAGRADLRIHDLEPIPAYNQDFEGERRPAPVKA